MNKWGAAALRWAGAAECSCVLSQLCLDQGVGDPPCLLTLQFLWMQGDYAAMTAAVLRLVMSRGTRGRLPSHLKSGDAGASLCCFLLSHAGKELLGALAHFRRAQVFFVCGNAPAIAKWVHKAAIAVTPELVGHRHGLFGAGSNGLVECFVRVGDVHIQHAGTAAQCLWRFHAVRHRHFLC